MRTLSARESRWGTVFGGVLAVRLLYPFFNSPFAHLYSDPLRHWDTGREFLHPAVMGGSDPVLYQLWLFLLQRLADHSDAAILTGCGLLCAAMPYGWYRALRELMPRRPALSGAIVIGLWPDFLGIYGYFMTETLLLTLTGFAFALTLRALRKRTTAAFAVACALWLAAVFTRIVVLPIALLCLALAWTAQSHKLRGAALALVLAAAAAVPAGLHARAALGYFAPLGNLYLNEIYLAGGTKSIALDFGPQGKYIFGSPSYYNPTFYPFSDWTSSRQGVLTIVIDLRDGRADWQRALEQARRGQSSSRWRDAGENLCYLFFGQSWPDNDRSTLVGAVTVWARWLWLPMVLCAAVAAAQHRYRGREWLLPVCALVSVLLLAVQQEGIMEGRYRKPVEPIVLAALVLAWHSRGRSRRGESEPARTLP
ncbi:MAG TPA: hypothetical protein VIX87_12415 [Steroidobacteraceae bacterium]